MLDLQLFVSGSALGCVYGLVALSFVLIYKATENVSFAQGELMMLGAFFALGLIDFLGQSYAVAVIVTIVAMGVLGFTIERLIIRPVLGEPVFAVVMLTFGVSYVARGGISMVPNIGSDTSALPVPYAGVTLRLAGLTVSAEHLVIIGATAFLCVLLYALFRFTRLGIAMQATSQNQLAAYYMGIPVKRLNSFTWALAAAVAAIAGVLLAPITFVHANMGFIALKAFPAAVVGGFGSLPGAIVGGLIIGVVESFAGFYLAEGFKDIAGYVVVLLVLMVWPNGLFGEKVRKKV